MRLSLVKQNIKIKKVGYCQQLLALSYFFIIQLKSECPLAILEYSDLFAVFIYTGDREVGSAYHKVNVGNGIVYSHIVSLLFAVLLKVAKHVSEAHAYCKMANRVFIVKGIVEENSGLIDGRGEGNQGAFAKVRCTLVKREHLLEKICVFFRAGFNNLTALKTHPEVFDKLASEGKGLAATNLSGWNCA